ncbi:MAG: amidohydrolase family protein [Candidatus Latescibacteria bacterium]|nr:amidohydrolase family protein [Candidatus Latescibacterota bacterium]
MLIDTNAWLGSFPFRSLRDNTPDTLIARMDRSGIDKAAVSQIEAIFHRNVQPANEKLASDVSGLTDRLIPMATVNPTYEKWEDDLEVCHESLGMKGVRLCPAYHDYSVDGPESRGALQACKDRGLPVFIPGRIEDPRQRSWMDPGRTVDAQGITNLMKAVPGATVVASNLRAGFSGLSLWNDEEVRDQDWFLDLSLAEVHNSLGPLAEASGSGHLVFGTHVPFSYPGCALVKLHQIEVDEAGRGEIMHENAERILNIG